MFDKKILNRRDFLKIAGVTTGGLMAAAAFPQTLGLSEKTIQKLRRGEGNITWRNTACRLCPGGCSLSIKRLDEVPISLKGNPHSPVNRGGTCPAAYANLELLYHPDRFTTPLARPEGPFKKDRVPVTWDEALASVRGTLQAILDRKEGYKIAIINGDDSPMMQEVWRNFARWIGTPNFYQETHRTHLSSSSLLTQGREVAPTLDIINADCIVSLGANFLEDDGAPVHFNQVLSQFKDLSNVTRNKLVYVGPRANITAASAHKWIPLEPDTWGTLALGLAHLVLDSPRVDLDWFRTHTHGFRNWTDANGTPQEGFENIVRSEFHPKRIEEITGIPEEDIRDLADLILERNNPVVLCGSEAVQSPRGELHLWATHCLNMLLGAVQHPGGWYFDPPAEKERLYTRPEPTPDVQNLFLSDQPNPLEKPSLDIFAKRVEGYAPYPIEVLIINKANPVYYGENRTKWKTLMKHVSRVVYLGDLPNETSAHADVILPTHAFLEDWDVVEELPGVPLETATLQRPVLDPMYDTKSSYDILLAVAGALPGIDRKIFPGKDAKTLAKKRLQKIYAGKQGLPFGELGREEWVSLYREHRSVSLKEGERSFLKAVLKEGGWWDPAGKVGASMNEILATSSGTFDFLPALLTSYDGGDTPAGIVKTYLAVKGYPGQLDTYVASESSGYPLTLQVGYPITNPYGRTAHSPTLVETFGHLREIHWENWAEIHPDTARELGVKDGTMIQIDSPVGMLKVRARIRPIIHPRAVFIPLGLGRTDVGELTAHAGSDPRTLIVEQPPVNRGNVILSGTPIRISIG